MTTPVTYDERHRGLWRDPDATGFCCLTLFLDTFGFEALSWSPITIAMEVQDEFGLHPHPLALEALFSAIAVMTRDDFYHSPVEFCRICLGLSHAPMDFVPDAAECAWGMTEAMMISPPEGDEPFSDEIRALIGAVLDQEGILNPPDVLRIALRDKGELLSQVRYDFADDPGMFEMVAGVEKDRSDAINSHIRQQLGKLLMQLRGLPLRHGNSERVASNLLSRLDNMERVRPIST